MNEYEPAQLLKELVEAEQACIKVRQKILKNKDDFDPRPLDEANVRYKNVREAIAQWYWSNHGQQST